MTQHTFILIKGEPKALQIEEINLEDNSVYRVKYKSSYKNFHYRLNDVVLLNNPIWHDHLQCKVYVGGKEQNNIVDIRSFQDNNRTHWRITYQNGFVKDYIHGSIYVVESCLADDIAKNSFEYLKRIALTNELGKDEEHGGILPAIYDNIDFIDDHLVAAPYLNPGKYYVRKMRSSTLIFPFGCNSSQEKAVTAAFENQLSVIQGPPGTGKTQTILNIIANILMQGKTVLVVSNNNSATDNIQEKLQKYGFDFIVAPLGKKDNKEAFIQNQPLLPKNLSDWKLPQSEGLKKIYEITSTLNELKKIYKLQEKLAMAKQEIKDVTLEWEHYKKDNSIDDTTYRAKKNIKSKMLMKLWLEYQLFAEGNVVLYNGIIEKIKGKLKWVWLKLIRKYILGIKSSFDFHNPQPIITELQALYYLVRIKELNNSIYEIESKLSQSDAKVLGQELVSISMDLLKGSLYKIYNGQQRKIFTSTKDLKENSEQVLKQYPVVLSTTFSARTSLADTTVYDYLIMDEASQVSIETGALAMTCARNAVIVGDTLQLPNVVTSDDRIKLDAIFNEYKVQKGYDCAQLSFLHSICTIFSYVEQTLLREHYRCHPKIINFCNQKFYGGNLIIMTEDNDEDDVMLAVKTVPGHHCRGHYNQREIDIVKQEVLPLLSKDSNVGIITPYNEQVDAFNQQIPSIETATIHKYQGREKDCIIMSTVDDQITEFSDDSNLLNVAISRAKKQFCIVLSGNEQNSKGNINDLVEYINYNNFSVINSKISSIFDYLHSHYTKQRLELLANSKAISEYDSENLTYKLLTDIIKGYPEFNHLGVLCHIPVRNVIRDWSLMNEEECKYVSHFATHLDFIIINHVTKKPVLAIETDGYKYHKEGTDQHDRDIMKNHILEVYGLQLLRISTIGSGEKEKILEALQNI